ncbi:MAG: hypothetical protein ACLFN0_03685 [Thermovirgaceae bacterium]
MATVDMLIVDAQNDFCHPKGSLFVPGAPDDTSRLCALMDRLMESRKMRNFHVTLDTHFVTDISHPSFWRDETGEMPEPFTQIGPQDLASGKWTPADPSAKDKVSEYLQKLESSGKYRHTIWPEHCILASWGHLMEERIHFRVTGWERREVKRADYILKGMNLWTEHYSVLKAEVEDPEDPHTRLNRQLLEELSSAEKVLVSGQALSHCVANTLRDMMEAMDDQTLQKLILLEDTTSSVPGFEDFGEKILEEAKRAGIQVCRTIDI